MHASEEPRPTLTASFGLALVVAAVLLALPGVRVVRAGDAPISEVAPGPTCAATDPSQAPPAVVKQIEAEVRQARIEAAGTASPPGFLVLNGRGYNYGPAPSADEVERTRAAVEARRPAR